MSSIESAPLISDGEQGIHRDFFLQQSNPRCTAISLKLLAGLVSASAKIPFIPISLKLPFGYAFAFGNVLGFWQIEFWAANDLIDGLLQHNSEEGPPKTFCENGKKVALKIAILIAALGIAGLSLLPQGFAATYYNKEPWKIPGAAVIMISGSFFPLRSIQLSLESFFRSKFSSNQKDLPIEKLRGYLAGIALKNKTTFENLERESQLELSADALTIADLFPDIDLPQEGVPIESVKEKIISQGSGLFLTLAFLCFLSLYTYGQAREQVLNKMSFGVSVAAATVLSNIYLIGKSIILTNSRLWKGVFDGIRCKCSRNLVERELKILPPLLKTLVFGLDCLAVGPSLVIYGDYFQNHAPVKYLSQAVMSYCVFLLIFTASISMIDDVLSAGLRKFGSREQKQIFGHLRRYENLLKSLPTLPNDQIKAIFQSLNERDRLAILDKLEIGQIE